MEETMYDVIVIGGGPGGYAAALYAARASLSVLVLEKFSPGGQMATTDLVENYPGFADGINGFELGMQMKRGAERFGVKTRLAEVTGVELAQKPKRVHTSKETFEAKSVILATGAFPRELGLENEERLRGRGVSYCATCDGMFYKGKTVVVVGGGDTAVADAIFLAKICKKVYLVHRREELRAAAIYRDILEKTENVEFIWNARVAAIRADQAVTGVSVTDCKSGLVREVACDGVFVAIGNVPNTALVKGQVELDEAGYVAADETTKTSVPGVFAVGDVRKKPLRQIVTAVADGAVASKFAEEYIDKPEGL